MELSIEILSDRRWSYAYAATRRPIIKGIYVKQSGQQLDRDYSVFPRVSFDFPLPEKVADTWEGRKLPIEARGEKIGETIHWDKIPIKINYSLLGRLQEKVSGLVIVEIVDAESGVTLARGEQSIELLAPNEWRHEPEFAEVFAAFVLPSDPFVAEIVKEARSILGQRTGSTATQGYQSGPERVHQIAHAVYDAMSSFKYAYSDPHGYFENAQKIRTPSQIKAEHCGTCLDTAVLMAACFAQVGLEPVLFLTRGHAFSGYFTGREVGNGIPSGKVVDLLIHGISSVLHKQSDYSTIQELLLGNHIQPVETTSTTADFRTFHEACSEQNGFTIKDDADLESIIIISKAWKGGITPPVSLAEVPLHGFGLPALVDQSSDTEIAIPIFEQTDYELEDKSISAEERAIPPRVRQWMASLLNLGATNPLLKIKGSQMLEFDLPLGALGELDDLLHTPKKKIPVVSASALPFEWSHNGVTLDEFAKWNKTQFRLVYPSYTKMVGIHRKAEDELKRVRAAGKFEELSDAEIIKRVRDFQIVELDSLLARGITKLNKKSNEVFLMTGSNSLYIALGTVSWSEKTDFRGNSKPKDFCAPLYLYPVILEGGKGSPYTIRLDPNGEVTPNYCLHEKLKRAPYNLDLQELVNPEFEDKGLDFDKMFQIVEKRFKQAKLDNFALQQRAVLGVFDYSTFRLWKDFKDNWKQMTEISPVVKHLTETSNVPFVEAPEPPNPKLEPHMPIAADDSQRLAVQWALDRKSFRLEGPPGTGKSQTISNLLASCIANNLKILFVAEKQTALNAVKDRLDANGLGKYTLNLHAKGDSDAKIRKNISDSLTSALNQRIDPEDQLWSDLSFRLKAEEDAIDRYRASLHNNGASGFSAWSAHEELMNIGSGEIFELSQKFIDDFSTTWPVLRDVGVRLENALELVPNPLTHQWRFSGVKDFEAISLKNLTQVIEEMLNLISNLDQLDPNFADKIGSFDIATLDSLVLLIDLYTKQYLPSISQLGLFSQGQPHSYRDQLLSKQSVDPLDGFIDDCKSLVLDVNQFSAYLSKDFLDRDDLGIINEKLSEVEKAINDVRLASIVDNWKSAEAEAANVKKSISIDLLETKSISDLEQAIDSYESISETQKFDLLINNAREIQLKASRHSPNVSLDFFQREDLINVEVLLNDAVDAGILARKRKSQALRELLGGHAIAKDDRLLFMSLKEMLVLAQESREFCDVAVKVFGNDVFQKFRPWINADIDFSIKKFKDKRRKSLEDVVNAKFAPKDEAEFLRSAKMLLELAKSVESSRRIFQKNFPDSYVESLRPWLAEDRDVLVNSLTHHSMSKLREAIERNLVSDSVSDTEIIRSTRGMLDIASRSRVLIEMLSTKILPGFKKPFRPYSDEDVLGFDEAIWKLRDLRNVISNKDLDLLSEILEVASGTEAVQMFSKIGPLWAQFVEMLELSNIQIEQWFGGRNMPQVIRAEFPVLRRDAGANDNYLELSRWTTFANALSDLEQLGLKQQALDISNLKKDVNSVLADVRRSVISGALRARMQEGNLDRFDRKVHERRIATFEAALKETQAILKRRIPGLVAQRRLARTLPTGKEGGATQDLLRGLKPSRGEKTPIRDLVSKYGKALSDAMPCFLMSPDSVATLIPVGSIEFDLVIFDEASQVRTSHAVGALGRGKAGIVVGDSRQMPPSNTFSSNTGVYVSDDDEDGEIDFEDLDEVGSDESAINMAIKPVAARDAESILTEFEESKFPDLQLLCHYRSKDEVLISFSNTYIYDQPMLTFPSIKGEGSTALKFVHVRDGHFERDPKIPAHKFPGNPIEVKSLRTNFKEAEQIVKEVVSRLRDPKRQARRQSDPSKVAESIIVVTFNIQQLILITEMFRAVDPELFDNATKWTQSDDESETQYPPQLKVRNLENVQGDEAETVIFSVAFSKTSEGKFPLNWGPVTAIGGDRRLNVAVTRAQNEMIVFASFLPDEMKTGGKTLSPNALMVYNFLRLAYEGTKKAGDLGISVKSSQQIERIASSLRALGYETQTQLGLSALRVDIAARKPGSSDWELAIMVDDTCWAERGSAFQRELLPKQVLPALGWKKVMRIWLPAWLNNPDEVLAEIEAFFSGQLIEESEPEIDLTPPATQQAMPITENVRTDSASVAGALSGSLFEAFTPFNARPIDNQGLIDEAFVNKNALASITKLINAILAAEAPIQSDRFAKIVCNSLGYSRVVPDRISQVLSLVPKKQIKKDLLGLFVWNSTDDPQNWLKYRTSLGESSRTHDEISSQEYANALIDIVQRAHSFGYEDAIKAVAEIFGFKRVTAAARTSIEVSFKKAIKDKRIQLIDKEFRPS